MRYWQLSGGPSHHPYTEVMQTYGVALLSGGDSGPWRPTASEAESPLGRFAADAQPGDAVLLHTGPTTAVAIGLLAGSYEYRPQFDDVNGWDLQHTRRARWSFLPAPYDFGERAFSPLPFAPVTLPSVAQYVTDFLNSPPSLWQTAPLPSLPIEPEELELDALPAPLQALVAQVQDLGPLYANAQAFGEPPSENELVMHYVVPLLRALGWPPELIALQWRYTDVCLFRRLPRAPENCALIIEAKRPGVGAESAIGQALAYQAELGAHCDVLVTDGFRYRLYAAHRHYAPVAYANLARLKQNALDLFQRLKRV